MLSWRTTSLEAERPGPRCGPAPRRGLRPAHPHCDCLVCQTSQLARTRCSRRPVLTLVPDSCHLGPGRREFQGAETHCSDLEWTPVSVVAQSAMIPPSSGSPAAPFILNDVHLSHYIWPPPTGRIKSVLIRLRGVPAWTLSEQGGFRPRGQSRLLPWSRGMTAVATAGPARSELPWARRRRCRVASCPFPRGSS